VQLKIQAFWMWSHVAGRVISDVSEDRTVFLFRVQQSFRNIFLICLTLKALWSFETRETTRQVHGKAGGKREVRESQANRLWNRELFWILAVCGIFGVLLKESVCSVCGYRQSALASKKRSWSNSSPGTVRAEDESVRDSENWLLTAAAVVHLVSWLNDVKLQTSVYISHLPSLQA
jgi:hypothetical protein